MFRLIENKMRAKLMANRKPYGHDLPTWIDDFQKEIDQIQIEWLKYTEHFSSHGLPIDDLSDEQVELNKDKKWKSLFLYGYTYFNTRDLEYFPTLKKILQTNQDQITLAMFSTTEAGKHIPAHTGNNHAVLRLQLGIDIKEPEKCMLRVEDKKFYIKEKEVIVFDDTFEHELLNESEANRTVLIVDYIKPLPWVHRFILKRKMRQIAKSNYVQSVLKKLNL